MSEITAKDVERAAQLGRLKLTPEEVADATKKVAAILDNFQTIQKIETKNTPTADDVTDLRNITRPDEAKPEALCSTDVLLKAAPATSKNQIKVRAVF